MWRQGVLSLLFLLIVCIGKHCSAYGGSLPGARPQSDMTIVHRPFDCFPTNRFPMIRAEIQSASEVQSARVYFHSDKFMDIYFVEMKATESGFEAVLPMPGEETRRIFYYIEAVDASFNATRTEEHAPSIDEGCQDDPAAFFPGDNPGIIIGALEAGAAAIPPGFQAAGLAGLVSAAGGGIGATTVVVAAAGAAGAAGAVVAAGGDDETTTTVVTPGTGTTTVPAGTTTSSPAVTSTVAPTTTTVGPTTTTPTTTSVSGSTTTTTVPAPEACFETKTLNFCRVKFDAQCSIGEITAYLWEIDIDGVLGEPLMRITPAEVYNHDFEVCAAETIRVRLTITDIVGRFDQTTKTVTLPSSTSPPGVRGYSTVPGSMVSQLIIRPTTRDVQGFIVFNGSQRDGVEGNAEIRHIYVGRDGDNQIQARLTSELRGEVYWRFDFSGSKSFSTGTIDVLEGQVSTRSGDAVVFRLQGASGEGIRFRYRLSSPGGTKQR